MLTLERLIEDELFIQCPLITSGDFIKFCKARDLRVNEKDLELYEKLEIFYPIARVEFPKYKEKIEHIKDTNSYRTLGVLQDDEKWDGDIREDYAHFWWGKDIAEEFHKEGLLWSPRNRPFMTWDNFHDEEKHRKIESYYSIFQIYPLYTIIHISTMNISLLWWSTYNGKTIDKLVSQIKDNAASAVQFFKNKDNISEEIASVCQIISNRYYPKTQTDKRTITITYPSHYHNWDWGKYCRKWDAKVELSRTGIDEEGIKKYQEIMSMRARSCDPIEDWYDLVQFVSLEKKKRLKREALLAQTFYCMEKMLRVFYKGITDDELSEDFRSDSKWKERVYGKGIPDTNMAFLEYLTNQFHLNPRPKLILIVEGRSEYEQIPRLAKEIGHSFDTLGIRIELLEGIGNFTSGKIERFIDHYHNLQTVVYLMLDNENNARHYRSKILKRKTRYPEANRFITTEDYIFLWDSCFEFDNFSDTEIADALSSFIHKCSFTAHNIAECRTAFGKQRDPISSLIELKIGISLNKPLLAKQLVDNLVMNLDKEFIAGKPERKVIIKIMQIIKLASRNYQPHSYELWKQNQESGYLGKKIE